VDVELVDVPDPVTGDLLTARVNRVKQLCREIPDSIWINQYANENNPKAHYRAMERLYPASIPRLITYSRRPAPAHLARNQRVCKDHRLSTKVIGVDAVGSVIFGDKPKQRLIPGHGTSRLPELYRPGLEHVTEHHRPRMCGGLFPAFEA